MQILDVSSNHFTGATYAVIKTSLTKNTSLRDFNVRMNDMLPGNFLNNFPVQNFTFYNSTRERIS